MKSGKGHEEREANEEWENWWRVE